MHRYRARTPLVSAACASVALLLLGCPGGEPASEGPPAPSSCTTDADCAAGERCETGSCREAGGGGSGGADECAASDDCREPFGNVPTIYWDGEPGIDKVCTQPLRSCPGSTTCQVATVCADVLDGATRPGGVLCEADAQCFSGRCVGREGGGIGTCLRECLGDGDCPYVTVDGEKLGLSCQELVEGNVPVRSCRPVLDPARTLCRMDRDCAAADGEPPGPGGARCRFRGEVDYLRHGVPLCEPAPAAPLRPSGARSPLGADCAGGATFDPCESNQLREGGHFCNNDSYRCIQPCDRDRDCPARTICTSTVEQTRAGDWLLPFQPPEFPGRTLRICLSPSDGCFDELYCQPEVDVDGVPFHGWSAERRRCAVAVAPPASQPRLLTQCLPIDGRTLPGECCAVHADCDTDLCVPARAGSPCDGGGVCSVPCDPVPDPDGVPASGDERDRCALFDFGASTYHQESSCEPFLYELAGSSGATELRVCR